MMQSLEHRIPPPIVTLVFGVLMGLAGRWTPSLDLTLGTRWLLTLPVFCVGLFLVLAGGISFRRARTTVNPLQPERASALVTSGIYRHTRNPMYAGFALFLLAWSLYLASPLALLGVAGFVLYINRFQIMPEERALAGLFAEDFSAYAARVRRWL
nr:isoprenylcysteine carboxylmethyltransferase family protein [Pseudomonas sp. FFPRI_1]